MFDTLNWITQAKQHEAAFAASLVSVERFNSALADLVALDSSPCTNIYFAVQMAEPFDGFALGSEGVGEAAQAQTVPNADTFGTKVRVSIWKRADFSGQDLTEVSAAAVALFRAFWKAHLRSSISWLISNENSQRASLIDKTLESALRGLTAFLYCDLDNFKSANDSLGHVAGDRIIREFAALVESAARPSGIALHRSGDEFLVLFPCYIFHQPLQIAKHLHELVRNHDFSTDAITIDVKIGISVFDGSRVATYHELESLAESAISSDGEKQRGRARFASVGAARNPPKVERSSLDTALVLLKSGLGMRQPFANPWLNLISGEMEATKSIERPVNEWQSAVAECLGWIKPNLLDGILSSALTDERPSAHDPVFSNLDVALAVAHAAFRGFGPRRTAQTLQLHFNKDTTLGELRHEPDGHVLFKWGASGQQEEVTEVYDLGAAPHWDGEVPPDDAFKRAVLVKIGHGAMYLPPRAFRDVVVVDDRPARGGGLPDFWESAIARLVAHCDASPNVSAIFLWGNETHAKLTWDKIGGIPNWQDALDSLTFRRGADRASLRRVAERLKSAIFRSDSADQLLPKLADVYRQPVDLKPLGQPDDVHATRFLVRRLDSVGFALSNQDGCRAKSIAQAFPLVLEIVRKTASGGQIVDQAGQELNELVDFKVHIDEPLLNMIPAFYRDQKESLDKYFEREFISSDGLFGRHLHNGEEAAVVRHVITSLSDQERPFHSRRAILVIPHLIEPTKELTPLGLVSVRIIPRSIGSRRIINYSFTWRTVEALVGFPYSLYGSVQYAQRLTGLIMRELMPANETTVEIGFVSYIAHSLHFFVDQYAQNIARRIVEDASE